MGDQCKAAAQAIAATFNILQRKWTLQIVHELQTGRRRFNELAGDLGGVNPRTLCQRLRELEDNGIVEREIISSIPPWVEYSLTPKGQALHTVIDSIEAWGREWALPTSDTTSSAAAASNV